MSQLRRFVGQPFFWWPRSRGHECDQDRRRAFRVVIRTNTQCTCVLPYALGNRFGISGGETANLWAYREEESRYRVMHPRRSHNLLCEFTQLLPTFALSRWGPHYDSGSRGAAFGSGSIWRRGQRSGRSRQGNCQGDDAKPHTLNHKRLVKRRKLDSMALMTASGSLADRPLLSETSAKADAPTVPRLPSWRAGARRPHGFRPPHPLRAMPRPPHRLRPQCPSAPRRDQA